MISTCPTIDEAISKVAPDQQPQLSEQRRLPGMKVLWINPSFLDYRVPVYGELDRLTGGGLHVIYSKQRTPERVDESIRRAIGSRAIGLTGERSIGMHHEDAHFADTGIRIPYQPGLIRQALAIEADVVIAEGFF